MPTRSRGDEPPCKVTFGYGREIIAGDAVPVEHLSKSLLTVDIIQQRKKGIDELATLPSKRLSVEPCLHSVIHLKAELCREITAVAIRGVPWKVDRTLECVEGDVSSRGKLVVGTVVEVMLVVTAMKPAEGACLYEDCQRFQQWQPDIFYSHR